MQIKTTRRRLRKLDPLAAVHPVRQICELLSDRLPFLTPKSEIELIRFLYAVAYIERKPATDTKRGRPGRWTREQLIQAASILRGILDRETNGRVSVKNFVSQYIQVLHFPDDILVHLGAGQINLQEAIYLNRISSARLRCSSRKAAELRREILQAHLLVHGSQTSLRARVKWILGESNEPEITPRAMAEAAKVIDELLEVDAADSRHLLWEQMKEVFYSMRDIKPDDVDDEMLKEFTEAMDQALIVLYKIRKRKRERGQKIVKDSAEIII